MTQSELAGIKKEEISKGTDEIACRSWVGSGELGGSYL